MRRIGILGGTFDPIHNGHLDVGLAVQAAQGLTEVLVIPAFIPPHRPQPFASAYHRFAMTAMATATLPGWRASDVELLAGGPSFTTDTLQRLHGAGYAPAELFFIIGADAFLDIESWKDFPAILDRARFVVVSRPEWPVRLVHERLPALADRVICIDAPTANVSATAIRRLVSEHRSIAGLVPPAVQQHIERHGLYSSTTADMPGEAGPRAPHGAAAGRLHGQE